jgi:hypothetical protein
VYGHTLTVTCSAALTVCWQAPSRRELRQAEREVEAAERELQRE